MENSNYMEVVTAQRALLLSQEDALQGNVTISLETQTTLTDENIQDYIEAHFAEFLTVLRNLSAVDQELLLGYYCLRKTQTDLAKYRRTTQTLCSVLIRKAVERIGTFILLDPTEDVMHDIFSRAGVENLLKKVPLSEAVSLYEKTRSFQRVAEVFGLRRPEVRRAMRVASQKLEKSADPSAKALAAFIQGLLEKASAAGQGITRRQRAKEGHIYFRDADCLGDFRIDIKDPGFKHVFTPQAANY